MISRTEAEHIRGVAEILRMGPSPAVSAQLANLLETIVSEGSRRGSALPPPPDPRQESLFGESEGAPPSSTCAAPSSTELAHVQHADSTSSTYVDAPPAHVQTVDGTSSTYDASEAAPSSSSDQIISTERKKSVRHRPHADDQLPEDFRPTYERVVAERRVCLPSAEYVWEKFVEQLWELDRDYATRWSLKRAWRAFVWYERALPAEEPPPASTPRLRLAATPIPAESDRAAPEVAKAAAARILSVLG